MTENLFAADYKNQPYWWEAAAQPSLPPIAPPASCDVAVVGSGYTGLCAAIELARGGRNVVVLDAEDAGFGCSTRNGGQVSTSIKPYYDELAERHGKEIAFAIRREGFNALAWIEDFVARTGADELMVTANIFDHDKRKRSFQIVAEVHGAMRDAA